MAQFVRDSSVPLRTRTWEILEIARSGDRVSKAFDVLILLLIFANGVAVIVGTVKGIQSQYGVLLDRFEVFSVFIFTTEYVGRLWSCTVDPSFRHPVRGRLRFAGRSMSLIDLAAILPFYLPLIGVDLRFIRILRLFRILRIAKLGRYYSSLQLMKTVVVAKKEELVLTSAVMVILLVFSACGMYYCEHEAQPEAFPDIPSTMWWSVATLTTVGYGDVFPITAVGKLFASIIAILGIGMFALPTGILGAGFVEEISRKKSGQRACPHCGKEL